MAPASPPESEVCNEIAPTWKKKLSPLEPPPVEPQPELLEQLNAKLAEAPALLRGPNCLNEWGERIF